MIHIESEPLCGRGGVTGSPAVRFQIGIQTGSVHLAGTSAQVVEKISVSQAVTAVDLHFDIEIVAIREATEEEVNHGQVHSDGEPH